ncbi:MAG TPA: hypothetical protein VHZ26_04160 [Caulobacteraceae bacterium]|nr:hypothetical protein [Caulobacteraceae bacterium]
MSMYMKFGDFKGDVTAPDHVGWIDLRGFGSSPNPGATLPIGCGYPNGGRIEITVLDPSPASDMFHQAEKTRNSAEATIDVVIGDRISSRMAVDHASVLSSSTSSVGIVRTSKFLLSFSSLNCVPRSIIE